jgi:hypothetical protein
MVLTINQHIEFRRSSLKAECQLIHRIQIVIVFAFSISYHCYLQPFLRLVRVLKGLPAFCKRSVRRIFGPFEETVKSTNRAATECGCDNSMYCGRVYVLDTIHIGPSYSRKVCEFLSRRLDLYIAVFDAFEA